MAKKKSSGSKSGGSKTRKPPQIDKMLTPAIGIAIAFLGYYFMKGMGAEVRSSRFVVCSPQVVDRWLLFSPFAMSQYTYYTGTYAILRGRRFHV